MSGWRHCPSCTCKRTPLEALVEQKGQVEAAKLLGCSQSVVSRAINGEFDQKRLQLELLALVHVAKGTES